MAEEVLLNAENIDQNAWGAINGCEAASLLEGLHLINRAQGINYGQFLKEMPISEAANPYKGFGGSPFKNQKGKFEAIFNRPLMKWGSRYATITDLSGGDVKWLYQEIQKHNPVIAYVTVHFTTPEWEEYPFGPVPVNNHAVLVDGVRENEVHVSDPIDGKYWLPKEKFEMAYNARKMALVLKK